MKNYIRCSACGRDHKCITNPEEGETVGRQHNIPQDFTVDQRKLPPDPDREIWTQGDSMVRMLRKGVVGLTKEKDKNPQLFKLAVQKVDQEFIEERITGQFEYASSLLNKDLPPDRKKELIDSAIGGAVNFALSVGDLKTYKFLAECILKYNIQLYE